LINKSVLESFGLSQSTVSRTFIEESKKQLEEYEKRDLGLYDFAALIIDGKYLSRDNIVIALGVTITGIKVPLGFIQTTTENSEAVKGLLKNLIERNFHFEEGLLTIIDGSKGLRKAAGETSGNLSLIQRCKPACGRQVAQARKCSQLFTRRKERYLQGKTSTSI